VSFSFSPLPRAAQSGPEWRCSAGPSAPAATWHSADQVLPPAGVLVLFFTPFDGVRPIWIGLHDGECWRSGSGLRCQFAVTHWMPLPTAPNILNS
jgi:hypothetical protein